MDHKPSPSDPHPSGPGSLLDAARAGSHRLVSGVAGVGKLIGTTLNAPLHIPLPGMHQPGSRQRRPKPGARAGIEHLDDINTPPPAGAVHIRCIDYSADRVQVSEAQDVRKFLAQPRPDWVKVRWINIDGLHPYVINQFKLAFKLHTLAAEDVMHVPQRPKVEVYEDHLFVTARMLMLKNHHLHSEQVSIFHFKDTLLTFQETRGDVFDPIRERIQKPGSRHRQNATGYLLYSLLDALVDHCFPILEAYGEVLEGVEHHVLKNPKPQVLQHIHAIKRELGVIRRVVWPTRDLLDELERDEAGRLSDIAKTYLRDVYDHAVQIMDIVETYREMANGLTDLYMSTISQRMNEVMKLLTIISTVFIPITFLAGVYGMNFDRIPELQWPYFYWVFWGICLSVVGGLMVFFYRKGWLGKSL